MADKELLLEKWRKIEGTHYSVSNHGRVKNDESGYILKPTIGANGYPIVNFHNFAKGRVQYVHMLVAEAFLIKPFDKAVVNHIDGNRANNVLTNLEYCSMGENSKHGVKRRKNDTEKRFPVFMKKIEDVLNEGNITWQEKKNRLADMMVKISMQYGQNYKED